MLQGAKGQIDFQISFCNNGSLNRFVASNCINKSCVLLSQVSAGIQLINI